MPVTAATRLAAVIGQPVRHSLSPVIHNAAFAATGLDAVYVALPVEKGQAAQAVAAMRLFGWYGMSVTMPHKHDVLEACDDLTDAARALDAANCLFWRDGAIVGDNTDGDGFVRGLATELAVQPTGLRCAVLGAGGAARSVVRSLAHAGAAAVIVIGRNPANATLAAEHAGAVGAVGGVDVLADVDLVVNATPLGMADTGASEAVPCDVSVLRPDTVVSDLIYHPFETQLLRAARARGLRCQNGLAMLVAQAATAFERWTGVDAPIAAMSNAVTSALPST